MNVYWNPCDINHDLKVDFKDIGLQQKHSEQFQETQGGTRMQTSQAQNRLFQTGKWTYET
jgi:hypothetical protein